MTHLLSNTIFSSFTFFIILANIQLSYSQSSYQEISHPDTVGIISMLPFGQDTIFVGASSNHTGGAYRSLDGGETWDYIGLEGGHVYCLKRGSGDTIYAGSSLGVYRSSNLGNSWDQLLQTGDNVICLGYLSPGVLFAGSWGVIMRSLDYGNSWDTSLIIHQNAVINSILAASETELYAGGTSYSTPGGGVFHSEDLGDSWNNIGLVGFNVQALNQNSFNELFVGCYYSGLLKTSNCGNDWDTILSNRDVVSIIISDEEMYIGCDMQSFPIGGIFYSNDNGVNWEDRTYNITNNRIINIDLTGDNYLFSLSKHESSSIGPPFNRSVFPVSVNIIPPQKNQEIILYPNPATTLLNIRIVRAMTRDNKLNLWLYNQSGQLINRDSIFTPPDDLIIQRNITHLKPGIYYIRILHGDFEYVSKVLIQ